MKKVLFYIMAFTMTAFLAVSCGSGESGDKEKQVDDNAMALMEHGRLKTLESRVAVLDSLIENYNKTVSQDREIEQFVFDSTYLKMFHGEKFNEKFIQVVMEIEAKEAAVLTSMRANAIMAHEN